MKLSENFTLDELTVTSTGLDNKPSDAEIANLKALVVNILQPLRAHLGKPIKITSGFRSPAVNKAIGGSDTSQHKVGQAADFHVEGMTNQQIIDEIRKLKLPYDQLIDEQLKGSKWIHVSYKTNGRKQWLTARDKKGGGVVYTVVKNGD